MLTRIVYVYRITRHVYRAIGQFKNLFVLSNKYYIFHKIFPSTKTSISITRRCVCLVHMLQPSTPIIINLDWKGSERRQMKGERRTMNKVKKKSTRKIICFKVLFKRISDVAFQWNYLWRIRIMFGTWNGHINKWENKKKQ